MPSPFDVLEVDPDADERAIQLAYRRKVKRAHPDHGGTIEAFQEVRWAYEQIKSGGVRSDEAFGAQSTEPDEQTDTRVTYLDYEVLDDYGWELDDEDLFEKAAAESLTTEQFGRFSAGRDESLLEAAESNGFAWPYACRGGACANCAVAVIQGAMTQPIDHILPSEIVDRGIRLSCNGTPTTAEMSVVFNVKYMPDLDELRLPPHPFDLAHSDD
ncbi:MAG: ferredoxin Fer [Halobacteriota archaeon]